MSKKDGNTSEILDVSFFSSSNDSLLKLLASWLKGNNTKGQVKLVFTPNSEMLVAGVESKPFREVLNQSDINIPDGAGVVLASRLLRAFSPRKIDQSISTWLPGVEVAEELIRLIAAKGGKVFFLGGWPGVAQAAAEKLKTKYPGLKFEHNMGQQNLSDGEWEDKKLVKIINESGADLLLVAYGPVKQEKWLVANKSGLKVKVAMGVGGSFDFWAGRVRRAPKWVNRMALEWFWRLVMEPWRWRRQLKLFKFWWLVFKKMGN